MPTVPARGTRRMAALVLVTLIAALAAAESAQAVTCCVTLRLQRTSPPPLWVGADTPWLLGAPVSLVPSPPATGNAEWSQSPADTAGGPAYHFINRRSNRCLDIKGPSENNGTPVHLWNCHSGASQAWRLVRTSIPIGRLPPYQLVNVYANKCLDVTAFRYRPGTLLQIWSCSGALNQAFVLERAAP